MKKTTLALDGGNLFLRSLTGSDSEPVTRHLQDLEVVRWTTRIPSPYSLELAEEFLASCEAQWKVGSGYAFAVCLRSAGELIGIASLSNVTSQHSCAELGFWLSRTHWGKGYMTEAARLVLAFGFEEIRLNRIYASAFRPNIGGRRVLEKVGFRLEGVMREAVLREGRRQDFMNYGLLRREFSS